ncbi:hypothetical protein GCM10009839_71210 [Catenulispora yoronensis]|uniref:HNH nuclease domain-containing protein n=2 Tax=Catenulispora yoronensis TaxID=450799 RepID=A0ABN2V717_9ACTN
MCRQMLATEEQSADDPSVFGEEAHIVGRSANGPRGSEVVPDVDGYENLILLCSKHHKQIDDQVNHFTSDRLRSIKTQHEKWVKDMDLRAGPARFITDPTKPLSEKLELFTSGEGLWALIDGTLVIYPAWPRGLPEEAADAVAGFLDSVTDWTDVVGGVGVSHSAKRDAIKGLTSGILEIAQYGLIVGGRRRHCMMVGGDAEPQAILGADIEVQPFEALQMANDDAHSDST